MLGCVIFWRGEILGSPEEHPCPEVTRVSFEGENGNSSFLLPACEACQHGITLH